MITRRQLLKAGALAGGGLLLPMKWNVPRAFASQQIPQVPLAGGAIPRYVDALPTFVGTRVDGTKALTVTMEEFQQQVLPTVIYAALPAPYSGGSYVWAYKISDGTNTFGPLYPGFTIEAQRGTPTEVKYVNNLVNPVLQQYITVDQTLHWADPLMQHGLLTPYAGPVPAVVHLHGGEVPSAFDGGPDSWFTPDGTGPGGTGFYNGPGYVTNVYTYPNEQEATTLFFHDHTLGATRLNLYAGLAAFYLIRDDRDTGLDTNTIGLPAGSYEIEIALQDRMFDTNGQLLFPDIGINPEHPFWIPEFFGDVVVVNGKSWPFLNVEPRRYRFRFVNGSNARFYELRLMNRATKAPGPAFWQIGTDGGLLDAPVKLNDPALPKPPRLVIGPGERADLIIDFAGYQGQTLTLLNSAKAPFPKGAAADPRTVGEVMQFRVNLPLAGTDNSYNPATAAPLRAPMVRLANHVAGALAAGVVPVATRQLTLNEVMGLGGPLEVLINNTKWDRTMSPNAGGITEMPQVGSTEVWEIVNLTADAHPIHVHLLQFQLINRQMFNVNQYLKAYNAAFPAVISNGMNYPGGVFVPAYGPPLPYVSTPKPGGNPDITPFLQGLARPPEPNENGWKDTVIMFPGEVTRIVVRWAPQGVPVGAVGAGTNTYPFDPSAGMDVTDDGFGYPGGPGYVWHCHIVDHEDNEMMRPYKVTE